jgi:biotin-(acetyl-CoA carboxylase) ligase
VLGLGVNLELRPGDLPAELAGRAGAAGLPADEATRRRLLVAFLEELDAALGAAADGERAADYRRRSWLTGRRVELSAGGERLVARIADVTGDGDLVLEGGRVLPGERVELLAVLSPPEHAPSR